MTRVAELKKALQKIVDAAEGEELPNKLQRAINTGRKAIGPGSGQPKAKLPMGEIRRLKAQGMSDDKIGEKFGVSGMTIYRRLKEAS